MKIPELYSDVDLNALPGAALTALDQILEREGAEYTEHPNDYPTKWGIRKLSAQRAGYSQPIRKLQRTSAMKIWALLFWYRPKMDQLNAVSTLIAETVLDTSGPAGLVVGITHLQEALTSFNALGSDGVGRYGPDLVLDGVLGPATLGQLRLYLQHRASTGGELKLATRLNCLQDAHYVRVALRNPRKRDFSYGWTSQRVYADLRVLAAERLVIA